MLDSNDQRPSANAADSTLIERDAAGVRRHSRPAADRDLHLRRDRQNPPIQSSRRGVWGREPQPGQTHDQFSERSRFFELEGTPVARSMVADVLASGTPVRDVERIVERADGTTLIVSVNIDPLRNAKGELVGAVNCFLDVTERKRMDAALERSGLHALEQEQRLAYEHAAIGISEIAPDGHFLRVNEAICTITGYSREHARKQIVHTYPPG